MKLIEPIRDWWNDNTEVRRDPIEAAQQLIQRPVSTEELYARQGEVKTVPMPEPKIDSTAVDMPQPKIDSTVVDMPTVTTIPKAEDKIPDDMYRQDGTVKSASGYLGPIESDTGKTMTEFTFDLNVKQPDGSVKEMRVPSLVPGLTQSEVNLLKQDEALMDAPKKERMKFREENQEGFKSIFRKAEDHAAKRLEEGKSVYYQDGEPISAIPEPISKEEPIQETQIQPEKPITRGGEEKVMREEDRYVVNTAYEQLNKYEGESGDTTGAAKTLKRGLTEEEYERQKRLAKDPELSEEQASKNYLTQLYTRFDRDVEGFSELSNEVKADIIHEAYNLGPSMTKYPSFTKAIKENNLEQIFFNLLDTANISGQTSKGIAVRRAELYNKYADAKIKTVEQLDDGTLIYSTEKGELFRYKKAKHKSSKAGKVKL